MLKTDIFKHEIQYYIASIYFNLPDTRKRFEETRPEWR
jgi:hypothetical protein